MIDRNSINLLGGLLTKKPVIPGLQAWENFKLGMYIEVKVWYNIQYEYFK